MTQTTPIKSNLFSFKTFRSPDRLDLRKRNLYFIHHPNLESSLIRRCPKNEKEFTSFIKAFQKANHSHKIRELDSVFFEYSNLLSLQKKNDSSKKQPNVKLPKLLSDEKILKVWDILFYQIVTQSSYRVRQDCTQIITAQYYIQNNDLLELDDISKLTIVIPQKLIECFKPWRFKKCGGELFGVENLGITDYRRVEQTLCCYVPGEVSHIENIMAKEYKERSTRNLLRTENTTEFIQETEVENLSDTITTERNEINKEVYKEIQKDKSFYLSGSVTVTKDTKIFGKLSANVSSGYSSNNSSANSNLEAQSYSKEITERALERVVQRISERRTYKMIKEFEENNKHGFDNRNGEKHITGVYRWVDKIYDNCLVNYGKKMVLEITVPSPALNYKKAMEWKPKTEEAGTGILTPPKTLSELGINSSSDLDSENANLAASTYGANITEYETKTQYINVDVPMTGVSNKSFSQTQTQPNIIIPDGFVAERIDGVGSLNYKTLTGSAYIAFNFAGYESYNGDWKDKGTKNFDYHFVLSPQLMGSIPFVIRYKRTNSFSGSLKVKCVTDPALFKEWQEDTYLTLQSAYQTKLDQYNEELKLQQAAIEAENDQSNNENFSNPALNRLIEERELKRISIEMMSKPYCYDFGKNFYECKSYECKDECRDIKSTAPNVIQNRELEKYGEFINFFESAFEWEILTYVFYPYYYNPKCEWSKLLQTKHDDPIFEAFLQSGMAKLLIPVRPSFEKAIMHYMETGEIYLNGDLVPETDDDRYLALIDELQNPESIVEGKWQTRVPSTLTIIQSNSTYLEDEKGLPCCEEDIKIFGSNSNTLQNINPE